jgi:hypothetical protein
VFYKLLGLVTWKAFKFYVRSKVPKKAVAAVLVLLGIGVASAVAGAAGKTGDGE